MAPAVDAADRGELMAWWVAYVNNSRGRPLVAQLVVTGAGGEAQLAHVQIRDDVPDAVVAEMVYLAVWAAACEGVRRVTCSWDHPVLELAGLQRDGDGWVWRADGPVLSPPAVLPPWRRDARRAEQERERIREAVMRVLDAHPGCWLGAGSTDQHVTVDLFAAGLPVAEELWAEHGDAAVRPARPRPARPASDNAARAVRQRPAALRRAARRAGPAAERPRPGSASAPGGAGTCCLGSTVAWRSAPARTAPGRRTGRTFPRERGRSSCRARCTRFPGTAAPPPRTWSPGRSRCSCGSSPVGRSRGLSVRSGPSEPPQDGLLAGQGSPIWT